MTRFSLLLVAKILVVLLLLVILRCLGEVFIVEYTNPRGVPHDLVHPFVVGAFAATLALALTLLQIQIGWLRGAIFIGAATIAGLLVYRIYFVPIPLTP
jgi:hypothetical protein